MAAGASVWMVYLAVDTNESTIPVRLATALMVIVAVTEMGMVYTVLVAVGSLPSTV